MNLKIIETQLQKNNFLDENNIYPELFMEQYLN